MALKQHQGPPSLVYEILNSSNLRIKYTVRVREINPSSLIRIYAWHSVYLFHLLPDKSGRQISLYSVFLNLMAVFQLIRSSFS
jgi:hypothetical protein